MTTAAFVLDWLWRRYEPLLHQIAPIDSPFFLRIPFLRFELLKAAFEKFRRCKINPVDDGMLKSISASVPIQQ